MVSFSKMMSSPKISSKKMALSLFALTNLVGAEDVNVKKARLSQSATSVNFFDPNGSIDFRLGQCVNLRTIYANGEGGTISGAIPFFTEDYIKKHTVEFEDPRTESHVKSTSSMKSESEVWSASLEIPFVPLGEFGYASGSISDKETTTKEHQSVKFHLGSYAMNNVFSIEHGNGGFSETDIQMSFEDLGCTHYVKEVHTGASVRAEIEMQSKSESWSKEQAAKIDATEGMYPVQAAMHAPKAAGELMRIARAGADWKTGAIEMLKGSLPFISGVADALNWSESPEITGSWSDTRKKALSNVSMTVRKNSRGIEDFPNGTFEKKTEVEKHFDNTKETSGVHYQGPFMGSKSPKINEAKAKKLAKLEAARKKKAEETYNLLPTEVQNMAEEIAKVQMEQAAMAASALNNRHTILMYTLVPIEALANENVALPEVVKMTDLDVTVSKEVGDVVKQIEAFTRWLTKTGEFVQDDHTEQFNECLWELESKKSDLQIRAMEHVNPTREQVHKFISEVRVAALDFTGLGFQNFEKCFQIYDVTVGKGATLARFHKRQVLDEWFDKFEKKMKTKIHEVNDKLGDDQWFFVRGWNKLVDNTTGKYDNVKKGAEHIIDMITELRDPTNKIFSEEYEKKICEKMDAVTPADGEWDFTGDGTYSQRNQVLHLAFQHLSDLRDLTHKLQNGSV